MSKAKSRLITVGACVALFLWWKATRTTGAPVDALVDEPAPAAMEPSNTKTPVERLVPRVVEKLSSAAAATPAPAPPSDTATERDRPDAMTVEERLEREQERSVLLSRWEQESFDSAHTAYVEDKLASALEANALSRDSLLNVECRRSLCRVALGTAGVDMEGSTKEARSLIATVRDQPMESWLLASEVRDDLWHVDVFLAPEGWHLNGPLAGMAPAEFPRRQAL